MTKANTQVIAKVAAIVAGIGLVLSSFAVAIPAFAQTTTTTTTTTSAMFTRDLTIGSTGADVTALQTWLIGKGFAIAAGATGYFGAQTQAALASYQAANGITPAAGYFGPITRAKVNAGGSTTVPGGDDDDDDDGDDTLGDGEASLEKLNGNSGDDDQVEENGTAMVAEFEFDVEDADVRIDRLDLGFYTDATGGDEDEPWNTFDTITIYDADGEELASEDVSDEDDWQDDDEPYVFRFTGLDYVVKEGDTGTLKVEVEAQNGIDGADTGITWTVFVDQDGIRGTDGDGLDQYLGEEDTDFADLDESVDFDVEEEGEGEELNVSSSDEDPDASVLKVEDDGRSDWHTIFAFDLDAEEAEIELEDVNVRLQSVGSTVNEQINDLELVIDGETFDDYEYADGVDDSDRVVTFDIDGDSSIGDGDMVTVELRARFNSTAGALDDGDTIQASIQDNDPITTDAGVNGEGADDVGSDGASTGEVHTLSLSEVEVTDVDSSTSRNEAGDSGTISYEFTIKATDGDLVIDGEEPEVGTTGSIRYAVLGPTNNGVVSHLTLIDGDATGPTGSQNFTIEEGDEATFSLDVTITADTGSENGSYRVRLDSVSGVEVDETSSSIFLTDL